jgi:hypothetical protein
MWYKAPILGGFLYIRVCLDTPGTAHENACGYRVNGWTTMTSTKAEKQEVDCSYHQPRLHCSLLTVCDSFLHLTVLEALSEIISMNRHAVTSKGHLMTLRYIYNKILILQKNNVHSTPLLSRGTLLTISAKVEATIPAQHTLTPVDYLQILWFYSKEKGATIPTQHTFHRRLS